MYKRVICGHQIWCPGPTASTTCWIELRAHARSVRQKPEWIAPTFTITCGASHPSARHSASQLDTVTSAGMPKYPVGTYPAVRPLAPRATIGPKPRSARNCASDRCPPAGYTLAANTESPTTVTAPSGPAGKATGAAATGGAGAKAPVAAIVIPATRRARFREALIALSLERDHHSVRT